ncbi:MAG: hypothetical protein JO116_00270, partial [Planctomycetaceae bacterium]|nr:hypothetical protein [Planctomycetaceae bacterium]
WNIGANSPSDGNFAPQDAVELDGCAVAELSAIRDDQELLRSFWDASDLSPCLG